MATLAEEGDLEICPVGVSVVMAALSVDLIPEGELIAKPPALFGNPSIVKFCCFFGLYTRTCLQ